MSRRTKLSYYSSKWWITDCFVDYNSTMMNWEGETVQSAFEIDINLAKNSPFEWYVPYYDDEAVKFFAFAKENNLVESR